MTRCRTPTCRKKRSKKDPLCPMCRKRHERETNPARYVFNTLKSNARRRKKDFEISFEYFLSLCAESGYLEGRGQTSTSLSIDRINNYLGYVEGNLRVITVAENSGKGANEEVYCPF